MIINNKNIRGIYLYDDSATFEKDDFVVYNNSLYICLAKSTGEAPEGSNLYRPYVSGNQATMEDIRKFIDDPTNLGLGEKSVSAALLGEVLSTFLSGLDYSGLINSVVTVDNSVLINNYFNNTVKEYSTTINPLDTIFSDPDLNNAVFKISREAAVGLVPVSETTSGTLIQTGLILRQYTYYSDEGNSYVRVQELLDYESGNIMFRYSSSKDKTKFASLGSPWRDSYIKADYVWQMNKIKNYYHKKILQLGLKASTLNDRYKYTSIRVTERPDWRSIPVVSSLVTGESKVFQLHYKNFVPGKTSGSLEILITGYKSDSNSINSDGTIISDSCLNESDINMTFDLGRITTPNRVLRRGLSIGNSVQLICDFFGNLFISITNLALSVSIAGVYTETSMTDNECEVVAPEKTEVVGDRKLVGPGYQYSYLTWNFITTGENKNMPVSIFNPSDNYFVMFDIDISCSSLSGTTKSGKVSMTVNLQDVLCSPTGIYQITVLGPGNFHLENSSDHQYRLILSKVSDSHISAKLECITPDGNLVPVLIRNSVAPVSYNALAYYYKL